MHKNPVQELSKVHVLFQTLLPIFHHILGGTPKSAFFTYNSGDLGVNGLKLWLNKCLQNFTWASLAAGGSFSREV